MRNVNFPSISGIFTLGNSHPLIVTLYTKSGKIIRSLFVKRLKVGRIVQSSGGSRILERGVPVRD